MKAERDCRVVDMTLLQNLWLFFFFATIGVTILSKRRPIDMLQSLLEETNGHLSPGLKNFFESMKPSEFCAMCLAIVCGHPSTVAQRATTTTQQSSTASVHSPMLVAAARKLYFELGGKPAMRQVPYQTTYPRHHPYTTQNNDALGVPHMNQDVQFSGKHGGLSLYMSRLLANVWKRPIAKRVVTMIGGVRKEKLDSGVDVYELIRVQRLLVGLDNFLEGVPHFCGAPSPSDVEGSRFGMDEAQAMQVFCWMEWTCLLLPAYFTKFFRLDGAAITLQSSHPP